MSDGKRNKLQDSSREEKLRAVALAFMADDPKEYWGETVEEVMDELRGLPDTFLDHAYEWFVADRRYS